MRIPVSEPVEKNLRFSIGAVVAVSVRNEHQIRGSTDPHAAETHFQATHQVQPINENFPLVEAAVAVCVFEDQNSIAGLVVFHPPRIAIGLGHPQSAAIVDRHGDWLHHVPFAGKQRHGETLWHGHRRGGFLGSKTFVNESVGRGYVSGFWERRPRGVESEVVEVDMSPTVGAPVDQTHEDLFAHDFAQVDDDALQFFGVLTTGGEEDVLRIVTDDFDAGLAVRPAGDKEGGERFARRKGCGGQRALWLISCNFPL